MAKSDGQVIIDTLIDTKGFGKGITNMSSQLGKLTGVVRKLGTAIGVAFSVAALVSFGKEAIQLGSDLQEVQNVVDVTFGDMSGEIEKFAQNAATQFGLSELAAKKYSSTTGAMLKSMGFATEQALVMSTELAGLAGDMASFYNIDVDEAFEKIRSGISGEMEPLRRLGIVLSVANLEQYALTQGITKSYNAMTQQEQALLRYNYLLSVTADAQGDFSRTSESWANQTRILSLQFESLKATIGQGLINALLPVIQVINTILAGLQKVANAFLQLTRLLFGDAGSSSAGQAAESAEELASGYGSAADSAEDMAGSTAKAAKEAQKMLAPFDEITRLNENNSSAGGRAGSSGGYGGGLAGGIDLGDYPITGNIIDEISPKVQAIADKIKAFLEPLKNIDFGPLRKSISTLGSVFKDLGKVISKSLEWAWFNILVPLSEWTIEEFAPAVVELLASAFSMLTQILEPLIAGFQILFEKMQPIFSWIGDTVIFILQQVGMLFQEIGAVFAEKGPQIEQIFTSIGNTISAVWSVSKPILTDIKTFIGKLFSEIVGVIGDAIGIAIDILDGLLKFISGLFTDDWSTAWEGIVEIFSTIWDTICGIASSVWGTLTAIFTMIGNMIKGIWNGVKTTTVDIWNSIVEFLKAPINAIIGFINGLVSGICSGLNAVIKLLNKLSISIPDWIPGIGGKTLGFNIGLLTAPQIPYLASGAVIPPNAPFMAVLGDQRHGTNVEAPLSTIQEAVAVVMEDMVQSNLSGHEATVSVLQEILQAILGIEIGDTVIGQATARYNQKMAIVRGLT